MKKTIILLAALVIAAAFALNCCGKIAEEAIEAAAEKRIEKETGEKVDVELGTAGIPEGLPSELIYPGAKKAEKSFSFSEKGKEGSSSAAWVAFETSESYSTVKDYYRRLSSKGWDQTGTFQATQDGKQATWFIYTKEDEGATVIVVDNDDKTVIGIYYAKED